MAASKENNNMETIISAFHMNWKLHPYPAMLIKADRTILAVNEVGEQLGIPTGMKCFQLTQKDKVCSNCQANLALKEKRGIQAGSYQAIFKKFMQTFWVPLDGVDGVFLHYNNDISQWVKDELLVEPNRIK